jgi:hypothetical protein
VTDEALETQRLSLILVLKNRFPTLPAAILTRATRTTGASCRTWSTRASRCSSEATPVCLGEGAAVQFWWGGHMRDHHTGLTTPQAIELIVEWVEEETGMPSE